MPKTKSEVGQLSVPVAVVVAEPVTNAKGKILVKAEETGNGAKAAATATGRSLSRSLSWSTLLFPALSFLAGVMAPPLRFYASVSFQNVMVMSTEGAHNGNQGYLSRDREHINPIDEEPVISSHSCDPSSDALGAFLSVDPVPGQHTLCLSDHRIMVVYRNSKPDEGFQLMSEISGQHWWTTFKAELVDLLVLSSRRHPVQPWAIFTKDGERLVDENYTPSDEIDAEILKKIQTSGVLVLFEGGQWIWPGIAKGFRRQVRLDFVPNQGYNAIEQRNVTLVTLSLNPLVLSVEGFLSDEECNYIQEVATPHMRYSDVTLMDHDQGRPATDFRTSQTAFLGGAGFQGLEGIDFRTASLVRIPRSHQEYVQVLRYGISEKYDAHHDYFDPSLYKNDPNTLSMVEHGKKNRLATVFWYLTDVNKGGETIFPRVDKGPFPANMQSCAVGLKVKPERGKVIIFYSMTPEGGLDQYSLHGACPVEEGTKWAANKWIWNKPIGYF